MDNGNFIRVGISERMRKLIDLYTIPEFYNPKEHCDHCYCQSETVYGPKPVDHKKCCQCGDRKVK